MKILLGNNTLSLLAGSETWTETMAKELKQLGHDVHVFSPDLGLIALKLEQVGIKCISHLKSDTAEIKPFSNTLEEDELESYDFAICNHYHITKAVREAYPNMLILGTIHGILHKDPASMILPEHPFLEGDIKYQVVSLELSAMLQAEYKINPVVVPNFIDLDRFKKQPLKSEKPKTFLVNSNYWTADDPINQVIKKVAEHYGAKLMAVGAEFTQTYEVEEVVKLADVVFGMGRSLLEGMAMGKLAVCHGRWGTGGVVTPETYHDIAEYNFSGRNSKGKLAEPEELIKQIDAAYNQENVDKIYEIVVDNHNSKKAALDYLAIAKSYL